MTTTRKYTQRRSQLQKKLILQSYYQSGMTVRSFSQICGIPYSTLSSWINDRNLNRHPEQYMKDRSSEPKKEQAEECEDTAEIVHVMKESNDTESESNIVISGKPESGAVCECARSVSYAADDKNDEYVMPSLTSGIMVHGGGLSVEIPAGCGYGDLRNIMIVLKGLV